MSERKSRTRNEYKTKCGEACCNCGTTENVQYHHVIPISLGGKDVLTNIVPLCVECHSLVHDTRMSTSQMIKNGIKKRKENGLPIGKAPKDLMYNLDYIYKNSGSFGGKMGDWEIRNHLGIGATRYCELKKKTAQLHGITEYKMYYVRRKSRKEVAHNE